MTSFFLPGVAADAGAESAYGEIRRQTELEMGRAPSPRRIASVWTRRGAVDCVTEVGRVDPLRGGTVIAIFDMGPHQPFVVWWQPHSESRDAVAEVLGCNAYDVREFDP